MEHLQCGWLCQLGHLGKLLFWLLLAYVLVKQALAPLRLKAARNAVLARFQTCRNARVIAMIHRQDAVSLLGFTVSSQISIEDSEAVLRAIRLTPDEQPIDLILHTPGGLVLAAEQIARALVDHKGKVTVFVPHYAMSGGTLLALAADEIIMDQNAVLGPVDPQIGPWAAASIAKIVTIKKIEYINDETLLLIDVAQKARAQVTNFVSDLLVKKMPEDQAVALALALSDGRWTHDFPITVDIARKLGLTVSTAMPHTVYELMDLYPQSGSGRPSVMYVPSHFKFPTAKRTSNVP
jgi:ClpP class serine protease